MSLNNSGKEPLYFQIKQDLIRKIEAGKWPVGAKLPAEPDLQEDYGASRGTVRRALLELEFEGYITRMSGRGTFVAQKRVRAPRFLGKISSFSQQVRQAGFKPASKVLKKEIITASEAVGRVIEGFGITPDAKVIHIERLRLGDGVPMSIQSAYLLPARCPGILDYNLSQLVKLYREKYGVHITAADEILRITHPTAPEAQLLQLAPGTAVVIRERISFDQNNEPFEVLYSVEAGEMFEYWYRVVNDKTLIFDKVEGLSH
jgi:GntR family transcriptional regulator